MRCNIAPSSRHDNENFGNSPVNIRSSSVHWRGRRASGNGYTLTLNALHDADNLTLVLKGVLGVIVSHAHNDTGCIYMGPALLSRLLGKSRAQCKRYLASLTELGYLERTTNCDETGLIWYETLYKVNLRPKFVAKTIHQPVDIPDKNDPTPPVINDPGLNCIKDFPLKPEYNTTPQAAPGVCESLDPVDPPQPKAEPRRRHEHNHPPKRSGRCREPLNAFQRAAVEVMRLCGVVESNWRTRDGIAAAIALRVDGCEGMAVRCVEDAVIAWKTYLDDVQLLRCPLGMEQFFVQGAWVDQRLWRYDQDVMDRRRRFF